MYLQRADIAPTEQVYSRLLASAATDNSNKALFLITGTLVL